MHFLFILNNLSIFVFGKTVVESAGNEIRSRACPFWEALPCKRNHPCERHRYLHLYHRFRERVYLFNQFIRGFAAVMLLNSLAFGNVFTTLVLNVTNSIRLKEMQEVMRTRFPSRNGMIVCWG